jgi:hypothetical protein
MSIKVIAKLVNSINRSNRYPSPRSHGSDSLGDLVSEDRGRDRLVLADVGRHWHGIGANS